MPDRPSRSSVRRMLVGLVVVGAMAACGGSSDEEEERQRLADDLVEETDGALDDDTARCVADALHDEYGDESFERVLDASANRSDGDADVRTEVIDIFAGCDALEPIIDDGS